MKRGYFRYALTFLLILSLLAFLAACSGSGGSGNIDDPDGSDEVEPSGDGPSSTPQQIALSTSKWSVKSDNSDTAIITATVVDKKNAVVENATVTFSADGGLLTPADGGDGEEDQPKSKVKTGPDGKAQILFSSGIIEKSNRVVKIRARVSGLPEAQIPVTITGTTVAMSTGKTNLEKDEEDPEKAKAILTITVKDAGLQPIYDAKVDVVVDETDENFTGDANLTPLPGYEDYRTDLSGQIRIEVNGTTSGNVLVKATALGASAVQTFSVGGVGEVFSILEPEDDYVVLSTGEELTVKVAAPDFSDYRVVFATTLGVWDGGTEQVVIKDRDENKEASAVLTSNQAGLANIQVYKEDDITKTDSITVAIAAPSSQASQIALQATATVVQPSTEGVNNTVTLIATVKNASAQVVSGAPVAFSINNTTGGGEFVAPVVVLTNSAGRAETTFTSGSLSSGAEGVTVTARVVNMPAVDPASISIVIGGTAGSVVIGRGSKIAAVNNDTAYELPMSVLVSDSNGNAVSGAEVFLKAWPSQYATGFWIEVEPNKCVPVRSSTKRNEDLNKNLILDPGEDENQDGMLTPNISAAGSLPSKVVTDENGVAEFSLVYLKSSAAWIEAKITASTLVLGTATQANYLFDLPWLAGEECQLPHSPFNTPPDVELLIEAVPTVIPANGSSQSQIRVLVRDSLKHNPIDSGEVYFSTDLGTISPVAITDSDGYAILGYDGNGNRIWPTLTSEKQNGIATVRVSFGDQDQEVRVAFSGVAISVTANPESLPTESSSTITATLKDAAGDPMAGRQIILTTTLGDFTPGPEGGTVSDKQLTATTNTQGRVTALLTSNEGGVAQVAAYHGPTKGTGVETVATTTVSFSGVELTITPEADSLVADNVSSTTVHLELKDEGVPVADQVLILSTTLGSIDYNVTTDADGKAVATLTAGSVVGVATITATADLGDGNVIGGSIEFNMMSGVVAGLDIVVDPPIISVDTGTADISVTVRDAGGNPVGAAQVSFTILNGPGGGETITPARITTPGPGSATPGQVTAVFKAGSIGSSEPGDVIIQVRAGDESTFETGEAHLTIAGRPANVAIGVCTLFGSCIVNNGDGTFRMPVAAMVSDVNGIGVPAGYLVYFSTNTPEVGALISPVATDDTGKASTTLTFPQTALGEKLTVCAETAGISGCYEFEIPFDDDEIAEVLLNVPDSILADGVQQVTLSAVAMEGDGEFSAGVSFFETNEFEDFSGRSVGSVTGTTYILFGETIASFTAVPDSQDYTVWVQAHSSDVFSAVLPIKAKGITIDVKPALENILANGESSTTVTATVKETTSKKPVSGAAINFGADAGTIVGSAFTDASGTATATLTSMASSEDVTATVYVYYGPGLMASTEVRYVASSDPVNGIGSVALSFSVEEPTLIADGLNSTVVTATVTDLKGNPIQDGMTVLFATTGGDIDNTAAGDQNSFATYTVNGVASAVLRSGTIPGQYLVSATVAGVTQVAPITFLPGVATDIILTANPYVIKPSGQNPDTSAITAVVRDQNGNFVANGTEVTFGTTFGTLTDPTLVADVPLPIKTVTVFQGVASVVLHSPGPDLNGLATVTAQTNGVSRSVNVVIGIGPGNGEPVFIQISAAPETIHVKGTGRDESAWIQAAVRDAQGFPYDDGGIEDPKDNIMFTILSGPGGGEVLDAGVDGRGPSVTTSTTGGIASVALNSGILPGTVRILVSVLKDTQGNLLGIPIEAISTPIGIESGGPYNITIYQDGDAESVINNGDGTYSWIISAMVQDQFGNPVADDTGVYFGLVDNPATVAYPLRYGSKSEGTDGETTAGSNIFTSASTNFSGDGVDEMDTLIILQGRDEGGHVIETPAAGSVSLFYNLNGTASSLSFVAGNAELGKICGFNVTGADAPDALCVPTPLVATPVKGVAHTRLTWPKQAILEPFCLYAESEGRNLGESYCGFYPPIEDVVIDVAVNPASIIPGYTGTITIQAHFYDDVGTDLADKTLLFQTSDTANSGFGALGTATTTAVTNENGIATVTDLVVADCRPATSITITVSIGDFLGTATLSLQATEPVAAFSSQGLGGLLYFFTDSSNPGGGQTITGWNWDFDDGSTSTLQNPVHDFPAEGVYNVQLTATNDLGCTDSIVVPLEVTAGTPPTADFSYYDLGNGDEVLFVDVSTPGDGSTITSWSWSFAGLGSSTVQNPTFGFGSPGQYPVTLTVTNNLGASGTTVQVVEVAQPEAPEAGFNWTDLGDGDRVAFQDDSDPGAGATIASWSWDFGGGTGPTTVANPTVSFGAPGLYSVQLTVTNSFGESDMAVEIITVAPAAAPTASFDWTDFGNGDQVYFNNTSDPGSGRTWQSWAWDIGADATIDATSEDLVWPFGAPGTYTVALTVENDAGLTDTFVDNNVVVDTLAPSASFDYTNGANVNEIDFTDTSTAGAGTVITGWNWDFGDGSPGSSLPSPTHDYGGSGTWAVTLTVTGDDGKDDSITRVVNVPAP